MPPRRKPLPTPLPEGYILTDAEKKQWKLGKIIGRGGFGLIHLASRRLDAPVPNDSDFVIKVEYQENGPLFSELKFYQRAAKAESIERWKKMRGLDFLGIPRYFASGLAEHNETRYRFMVMDRLGIDLQKYCDDNGGRLKRLTVLRLGYLLVDVLEYIHDNEYVHADIKAANLLLDYTDPSKVYLADYGLSYRYCPDSVHKEYKENPKKGHNGTIEYTSMDAHNGVDPSRRGDLEVLGYCLLHWLCGRLPWDCLLKRPLMVQEAKAKLMANLPDSVLEMSPPGTCTEAVARFLLYMKSLGYKERPDYQALRDILAEGRPKAGRKEGALDLSRPRAEDQERRPPPSCKSPRSKPAAKASPQTDAPLPRSKPAAKAPPQTDTPLPRSKPAAKAPPQTDTPLPRSKPAAKAPPQTDAPLPRSKPAARASPRSRAPPREDAGTDTPLAKPRPAARAAPKPRAPPSPPEEEEPQGPAPARQRRPRTQPRQGPLEEERKRPQPKRAVRKAESCTDGWSEERSEEADPGDPTPLLRPLRDTPPSVLYGAFTVLLFLLLALLLVHLPHLSQRAVRR